MSSCVLDASALLALLREEPGSEQVAKALDDGAVVSLVNLSEVVAKLSESGMPEEAIREVLDLPGVKKIEFDAEQAYQAGLLRPLTKSAGLSLGDRACLALARRLNLPVLTTDRVWQALSLDIVVQVIR
jgi:ribonuclease VapC